MRREELYLTDILEAADAIGAFLKGIERSDFLPLSSAVYRL